MNAQFVLFLIGAVVGRKVDVELDKDFLDLLDVAFSERIKGLEKTVLSLRFGHERVWSSSQIASQLRLPKDRVKEIIDSGVKHAESSLNLGYFKDTPEHQRSLCHYFRELFEPVNAYSSQILQRANRISKVASFNLSDKDPYSTNDQLDLHDAKSDIQSTTFFVVVLKRLCSVNIDEYPNEKLGCLCVLMSEINRKLPRYIPCLINREINCARAERSANLSSWHCSAFSAEMLEMYLENVDGCKDCTGTFFEENPKVKDILAYEAAELAFTYKFGNKFVLDLQHALIALSERSWKGWNSYWEKYYSWDKTQ